VDGDSSRWHLHSIVKIWINVLGWTAALTLAFRLGDVTAMLLSLAGWYFMHDMIEEVFGDDDF